MCWLRRSVLLCLLIIVVTPAPAHAWFEWLHRLSGPGHWWGTKVDVRAFCFGKPTQVEQIKSRIEEVTRAMHTLDLRNQPGFRTLQTEWLGIIDQLEAMDAGLNVVDEQTLRSGVTASFGRLSSTAAERVNELAGSPGEKVTFQVPRLTVEEVRDVERPILQDLDKLRDVLVAIASGGIFISLCSEEKIRLFGVEFGSTWMWTGRNDRFAGNESIALKTFTVGLSYRIPRPTSSDVIDLGTNVGVASFSSKGFNAFDTLTIEPFVDLHFPSDSRLSTSKATRVLSRFTLRTSYVFFPKGFEAGNFGPSAPRIPGSEANLSFTLYYNVRFTKPTPPLPRPGA